MVGLTRIQSVLDVGSGHGGVYDSQYWTHAQIQRRATCDIHSVREMGAMWEVQLGVNAEHLTEYYEPRSFDLVQCMEVLEHVSDSRAALEQLCEVARKIVVISSCDELHHGYDESGNFQADSEQAQIEKINPHDKYLGQPRVGDMHELGFTVAVERTARRQLIAWKIIDGRRFHRRNRSLKNPD